VGVGPRPVPVGPGEEGGVSVRVLGNALSRAFPSVVRRQASKVALETSIPITAVAVAAAVPTVSSPHAQDAGSPDG